MNKRELAGLLLIIIVTVLAYLPMFSGFFQQDEWLSFAHHSMLQRMGTVALLKDALIPSVGHYQPLNTLVIHWLFSVFKLNYVVFSVISLSLHLVVIILVFILYKKLLNRFEMTFLATLFFGTSVAGFQATSWVLADIGIHLATIFSIISILFFLDFLENHKNKYLQYCLVFLVISFLFKEIAIGLFLIFPLLLVVFSDADFRYRKSLLVIFVVAGAYILIRGSALLIPQPRNDVAFTTTQSAENIVFNIINFPIQGISQTIAPSSVIVEASELIGKYLPDSLTGSKGVPAYDMFVEKKLFWIISVAIAIIILILSVVVYKKQNRFFQERIFFSLVFIMLNMPIYALAPEKFGKIFIIDPRNLYFVTIGAAALMILLLKSMVKQQRLVAAFILILVSINVFLLNDRLSQAEEIGSVRKNILNQISQEYPVLPQRTVFYTESDKSFYGLPPQNRIMPFQSGFGQTLLIWYLQSQHFPDEFIKNKYLWEIDSQGYKEVDGIGFGYFRDFESLAENVYTNDIDPGAIIAYSYDSEDNSLNDISEMIGSRLEGYLSSKGKAEFLNYTLSSDFNLQDIGLLHDGNRNTYWSSGLEIVYPQSLVIDIGHQEKICLIQIDSNKDIDQDKVGYRVEVSKDGTHYNEVFSSLIYPPNKDGIANLYFKPIIARFIRLIQEGRHEEAFWRLAELRILKC